MLRQEVSLRQVIGILISLGVGIASIVGFYLVPHSSRGLYLVAVFALYFVLSILLTVIRARRDKRGRSPGD